jgi:hypothetical protein
MRFFMVSFLYERPFVRLRHPATAVYSPEVGAREDPCRPDKWRKLLTRRVTIRAARVDELASLVEIDRSAICCSISSTGLRWNAPDYERLGFRYLATNEKHPGDAPSETTSALLGLVRRPKVPPLL